MPSTRISVKGHPIKGPKITDPSTTPVSTVPVTDPTTPTVDLTPASITIAPSSAASTVGAALGFTATFKNLAGDVLTGVTVSAWHSDNEGVATVSSSGVVTMVAEGTVHITATLTSPALTSNSAAIVVSAVGDETILATHGFEDGTLGPFTNPWGVDIDVIDDPTGLLTGKVARIHYAGSNQDKNRSVQFEYGPGIGRDKFAIHQWKVVLPAGIGSFVAPELSTYARKLAYFQRDLSTGFPEFWVIITTYGNGLSIDYGYAGQPTAQQGPNLGAVTLQTNHAYTLKVETKLESAFGANDGIVRVWLDGVLIHEDLTATFADPAWTADPANQKWRYFLTGDQVNTTQTFDEYRYIDDITISTR